MAAAVHSSHIKLIDADFGDLRRKHDLPLDAGPVIDSFKVAHLADLLTVVIGLIAWLVRGPGAVAAI